MAKICLWPRSRSDGKFSLSQSVFKRRVLQTCKNERSIGKELNLSKAKKAQIAKICLWPLPRSDGKDLCNLTLDLHHQPFKPFPKRQILDSSKLKVFADDSFKFYENGQRGLEMGKKHCGKRRNCSFTSNFSFSHRFF